MYIIRDKQDKFGRYTTFQVWNSEIIPECCFECPYSFKDTFFLTDPGGFVNIEADKNKVITKMTVNTEAYNAYLASLPEPEPEPDREPTADEILNALLGVNA
jgi:hypothetical protein